MGDDVRRCFVDGLDHVVEGVVRGIRGDHLPADELAHVGERFKPGVDPQVAAQRATSGRCLARRTIGGIALAGRGFVRTPA